MAIDIEAIANLAAKLTAEQPVELQEVLLNKAIYKKTVDLLLSDPLMMLVCASESSVTVLQVVASWYWMQGRLYGQQEMIDKTVAGMEE